MSSLDEKMAISELEAVTFHKGHLTNGRTPRSDRRDRPPEVGTCATNTVRFQFNSNRPVKVICHMLCEQKMKFEQRCPTSVLVQTQSRFQSCQKNTRLWTKSGLLPIVNISDFERIFETYKIAMTMIISPLTAVLLLQIRFNA